MTETNASNSSAAPEAPNEDDPRFGFAKVVDAVGNLMEATTADMLGNSTPCPEFKVKELLEHMVMVARRVAVIGRGEHWSTVDQESTDSGWAQDFRTGAHDIMTAWSDPAILQKTLEVPWGAFPGAALMYTYTAELAVHGWDLATATNREFSIDDDVLHGALAAIKFVPAEGRESDDVPFSAVVDPGPDASVLAQLAGWAGRDVLA